MKSLVRPFPPSEFMDRAQDSGEEDPPIILMPAPELMDWAINSFLHTTGPLYNPDHTHIFEMIEDDNSFLAFAWASAAFKSKQAVVLGQCEKVMFNVGGWRKARQEQQMRDWFGYVPTYLIIIDASFCEIANDRDFCALIEHELYHIGVKRTEEGEPIYSAVTGLPACYLAGHDVEEFFGVVKRYGANENVKRLVEIAQSPAFESDINISKCCGTCAVR